MWKLGLALTGCIILGLLFMFGNAADTTGNLVQILLSALGAIVIVVIAISIAPWLSKRGR